MDKFTDDIADYQRSGQTILVVTQHGLGRLEEILSESGMGVASSDGIGRGEYPQKGKIYLAQGSLREGWTLAGLNDVDDQPSSLIVITDAELFGSIKERRRSSNRTRSELGREIVLSELIPDSFVVHVDHGVAKFTGTRFSEYYCVYRLSRCLWRHRIRSISQLQCLATVTHPFYHPRS